MGQYVKTVPKHPADPDKTLEQVLYVVIFQTQDGDELIAHDVQPDKVVLTFDENEK